MPRIPYKLKEKVQLDVATKAEAQALLAILEKDAGEIAAWIEDVDPKDIEAHASDDEKDESEDHQEENLL